MTTVEKRLAKLEARVTDQRETLQAMVDVLGRIAGVTKRLSAATDHVRSLEAELFSRSPIAVLRGIATTGALNANGYKPVALKVAAPLPLYLDHEVAVGVVTE